MEVMTMEVTVKVFGELYRYLPGRQDNAVISISPTATLEDLVEQLEIPDHAVWIITVNGQRAPRDHQLAAGDSIAIFAPVAGG
jgi:sulfur carrier protein ThiS